MSPALLDFMRVVRASVVGLQDLSVNMMTYDNLAFATGFKWNGLRISYVSVKHIS